MSYLWLVAAAAALLCGASATARAGDDAPLSGGPEVTQARIIFEEGKRLMHAGDCERALERFRASRALHAGKGNTRNAAHCLGELERWDEALEMYEDLIGRFGADLTTEDQTLVASIMARYRRSVGTLDVSANIDGLLVVDGRPRGQLPLAGALRLLPGAHLVRIVKGGYVTHKETVAVAVGQTTKLDATLAPLVSVGRLPGEVDREHTFTLRAGEPTQLVVPALKTVMVDPGAPQPRPMPEPPALKRIVVIAGTATATAALGLGIGFMAASFVQAGKRDTALAADRFVAQCYHTCPYSVAGPESARVRLGNMSGWSFIAAGALSAGTLTYVHAVSSKLKDKVSASIAAGPGAVGATVVMAW